MDAPEILKQSWIVTYGGRKEKDRKKARFDSEKEAVRYWREKEKDYHTDIYHEITAVYTKRLAQYVKK